MPKIMIELTAGEWDILTADAKRERRTPQAQGAVLLSELLRRRATGWNQPYASIEGQAAALEKAHRIQRDLAEADGATTTGHPGGTLTPEEEIGPVQGHGDGA